MTTIDQLAHADSLELLAMFEKAALAQESYWKDLEKDFHNASEQSLKFYAENI